MFCHTHHKKKLFLQIIELLHLTEEKPTVYIIETSQNLFTWADEPLQVYRQKKEGNFIVEHQREVHGGAQAEFCAKVTNNFRDCLTRLVSEAVSIRRSDTDVLNSKSE